MSRQAFPSAPRAVVVLLSFALAVGALVLAAALPGGPATASASLTDLDNDGLPNNQERPNGCNALKPDTDGGGVRDGAEVARGSNCKNAADDLNFDSDGDGSAPPADCDDNNPAIHPGAPDPPDANAIDANCDRFDGNPAAGIFVSLTGDDLNPGTMALPKRTVQAAIDTAFAQGKEVFLDSAIFDDDNPAGIVLRQGVDLYGGYRSVDGWTRGTIIGATRIEGAPQAVTADAVSARLQLLEIRGAPNVLKSAYGLRAINGANVTLERVRVRALDGIAGERGGSGTNGIDGRAGAAGGSGDSGGDAGGGGAGATLGGNAGGDGGDGGQDDSDGQDGAAGAGPAGGIEGEGGSDHGCDGGDDGTNGGDGSNGTDGADGVGGGNGLSLSTSSGYVGADGTNGSAGTAGSGGGGGGGGGGQGGASCTDGGGAGGGGGGSAGTPGSGAVFGRFGGASFAIYIFDAHVSLIGGSFAVSGDGGKGGDGGSGGIGGAGGEGGGGGAVDDGDVGNGGDGGKGGRGGNGGDGGAGAGGPSAAIAKFGTSTSTVTASTLTHGFGGPGGASPAMGASNGAAGQAADILP